MAVKVGVAVDVVVVAGGEIARVVVNEDYLLVVEAVKEECS